MALSNKNITIHVGMPKSASTTLQQYFFKKLKNVHYFGPEGHKPGTGYFLDIIKQEKSYFEAELNEKQIENLTCDGQPVIMSSEFASSYLTPLAKGIPQTRTIIRDRLAHLAPQAKIIIILRNQFDLHRSLFVQLLRNESDVLNYKNFQFEDWLDKNILLSEQHWQSVFELADYDLLVKLYKERFENVHVYLFEEITKNMQGFINDELVNLLNLKPSHYIEPYENITSNPRHTQGEIATEKVLVKTAKFMKNKMGNPLQIVPKSVRRKVFDQALRSANKLEIGQIETPYSERHRKYIQEYYKKSNNTLSMELDKDLSTLGYPL